MSIDAAIFAAEHTAVIESQYATEFAAYDVPEHAAIISAIYTA